MSRPARPPRGELETLIRETGGNVTQLAGRLGVSRPTAYTWLYQLGLAGVVGVRAPEPPTATQIVSASLRLPAGLWREVRKRAIDEDRSSADVVADALRGYLEG